MNSRRTLTDDAVPQATPESLAALSEGGTPLLREVLEALALGAVPRTRTWVLEALADPRLRTPGSPRPKADGIKAAIACLSEAGWLQEAPRRNGYWSVVPVVSGAVYDALLQRVSVDDLRAALARADEEDRFAHLGGRPVRWSSMEMAVARLRLEAFAGASPETLQAFRSRLPWGVEGIGVVLDLAVVSGLTEPLWRRLHPALQDETLVYAWAMVCQAWQWPADLPLVTMTEARLQAHVGAGVPPAPGAKGPSTTVLAGSKPRPLEAHGLLLGAQAESAGDAVLVPDDTALRVIYAEALLLMGTGDRDAGDHSSGLARALTVIQDLSSTRVERSFLVHAFAGAVAAMAGEWAQAERDLDEALLQARKCLSRRRHLLPTSLSVLYVLSLLAQQTPAHWQKALKFCLAEGGKREPQLDSPFGFMALAVQMRQGDRPRDMAPFQPFPTRTSGHVSPLDLWRWLMRAYLKDGEGAVSVSMDDREIARHLRDWLQQAQMGTWLDLLDKALKVLDGESPGGAFFVPAPQARWQTTLAALAAVMPAAPTASQPDDAGVAGPSARWLWLLALDRHGAVTGLSVHEQKRGVRGWGKPKPVTLSRLQRSTEALAPHDALVARTLRATAYGRDLRFDLPSAVAALVDHPCLALEETPEQLLNLSTGGPELEVISEPGARLRVCIHPALHAPDPQAPMRWAVTPSEQKEQEALRGITVLREGPSRARLICLTPAQRRVAQLLGPKGLEVPRQGAEELQRVLQGLGMHFHIQSDDAQTARASRECPAESRLRAELQPVGDGLQLRLVAAPFGESHAMAGPRLIPGQGRARLVAHLAGENLGVQRDLALERTHLESVLDACPMLGEPAGAAPCEWLIDDPEMALLLLERLHQHHAVAALDWPQGQSVRVVPGQLQQLSLQIRTKQDWLAVQGGLALDEGLVVSVQQLISFAAGSRSRFLPLGEGRFVALTQELRERIDDLAAVAEAQSHKGKTLADLRVPTVAAPWLGELLAGAHSDVDPAFARRLSALDEARRVVPALPTSLQASLRPYQEEGFEWAMRLASAGLGACLADDMGLGKTLQALAVLLARATRGPALVVAPTSLLGNWRAEARRFAPSLRVHLYAEGGAPAHRAAVLEGLRPGDVMLVSYPMLQIDGQSLAQLAWGTLILDEAQAIKNAAAKRSQAVFELRAEFRLALSGTPIENRLAELWSIMRACNPGLLGTQARFNERFATLIERQRDRHAQRRLRRLIAPFMLRRTKAQVLDDLPPRTELVWRVNADERERAHYEVLRRDTLAAAERALSGDAPGQAHLNILAGLTRLRRAACDPRLVSPELGLVGAKVKAFGELAAELVANGHKALVFSQFVDFLSLLREPLDAAGIAYHYLDGSTPAAERTRRVDAFQAGEGDLFLISLKAGGFGLNLTVADYVVIADPWWNPAAEDQASGRAHRIGQQRPVTVYRLVNEGTLEERILSLHHTKRELADSVLEGMNEPSQALPAAAELVALMRDDVGNGDE